jgi:2-polyprenyl-3-methyl-5-hydroxy-6-metoxy-1,4-benzoquinol methylase
MDNAQKIQDEEYHFPYHYLSENPPNVSIFKAWGGSLKYLFTQEILFKKLKDLNFNKLADIGTGDGKIVRELNKLFPEKEIIGIDYSVRAIALAKALNPGLKFQVLDINKSDIADEYDIITSIEVIEHIPKNELDEFINSLYRLLKPGGYLLLTVPHANVPLVEKHYQHFNEDKIIRYFSSKFEICEIFHINGKIKGLSRLILRIWNNKLFLITNSKITNHFYRFIAKKVRISDESSATGLFAVLRKNKIN